jgi:MFS family permease
MIKVAPAAFRRYVADRKQPPVGRPFVLGRHASLLVSAGVVSHTLWTSAAPALTYGLYAQEWHLTHTVTAAIFAVYPIFVVVMLVGFGGISDQIGRRETMLAGLFASLTGALLFAVAPDRMRMYCQFRRRGGRLALVGEARLCRSAGLCYFERSCDLERGLSNCCYAGAVWAARNAKLRNML